MTTWADHLWIFAIKLNYWRKTPKKLPLWRSDLVGKTLPTNCLAQWFIRKMSAITDNVFHKFHAIRSNWIDSVISNGHRTLKKCQKRFVPIDTKLNYLEHWQSVNNNEIATHCTLSHTLFTPIKLIDIIVVSRKDCYIDSRPMTMVRAWANDKHQLNNGHLQSTGYVHYLPFQLM